jgi:hypothetical protein
MQKRQTAIKLSYILSRLSHLCESTGEHGVLYNSLECFYLWSVRVLARHRNVCGSFLSSELLYLSTLPSFLSQTEDAIPEELQGITMRHLIEPFFHRLFHLKVSHQEAQVLYRT